MAKFDKMLADIVGQEGYDKLTKAVNLDGTATGAFVASRAVLRWFHEMVQSTKPGTARYVDMPGIEGTQVYIEKSEDSFMAELVRDGASYYVLNFEKGGDNWNEKYTAVPSAILAENGVSFDVDQDDTDIHRIGPKLTKAVDALVIYNLKKSISEKKVEGSTDDKGDKQDVKNDITPDEKGRQDEKDQKKNKRIVVDPDDLRPDKEAHEECLVKEHDTDMKAKSEPLKKPYVSQAQQGWAHTPAGTKALGGSAAVQHWDAASKGKKLPEHVSKAGIAQNIQSALGSANKDSAIAKLRAMRRTAPPGKPGTQPAQLGSAMTKLTRLGAMNRAKQATAAPMMGKAGDMPGGAAMPKAPKMPSVAKPPSNKPQAKMQVPKISGASAMPQMPKLGKSSGVPGGTSQGQPRQAKLPKMPHPPTNKMPFMKIPKSHGGPKLSSAAPKPVKIAKPQKAPLIITSSTGSTGGHGGVGKSEKHYPVTDSEIYSPCHHCGIPEFIKSESGPKFKPCACFESETTSMEGTPKKFVELVKSADGKASIRFAPDADPEAKKMFLLLIKASILAGKKF